jgi:thioredoxin 1
MLGPIMNEISQKIPVQKIDVDSNSEIAQRYGIRQIPTVVLVNGDAEVTRFIGVNPKQVYLDALN